MLDVAPLDGHDPVTDVRDIETELAKYSDDLASKERWLVFTKIDNLPPGTEEETCNRIIKKLNWNGPVFKITALKQQGTNLLCGQIMNYLENVK